MVSPMSIAGVTLTTSPPGEVICPMLTVFRPDASAAVPKTTTRSSCPSPNVCNVNLTVPETAAAGKVKSKSNGKRVSMTPFAGE